MGIEDTVSKEKLYAIVVKDPCKGRILKEPKFEIVCKEIDEIYLNVKKFQRGLSMELVENLNPYLRDVESGYVGKNFEKFSRGVCGLMERIYLI